MSALLTTSLEILKPDLPPALFAPEAIDALWNTASLLAPIPRIGLECRLDAQATQVDLQQCILNNPDEIGLLRTHLQRLQTIATATPTWRHLDAFCASWAEDGSLLQQGLYETWLEFDIPPQGSALDVPSIFVGLASDLENHASYRVLKTTLELLWNHPLSSALEHNLQTCIEAATLHGAHLSHLGLMLSRSVDALRLNIKAVPYDQVLPFLKRINWPGNFEDVQHLLQGYPQTETVMIDLDLGTRLYPTLGVEFLFEQQPDQDPRWAALLDHLVQEGLCSSDKRDALLGWTGYAGPPDTSFPWPASFITGALLTPTDRFSVLGRLLNHLKLTLLPGRPLEAKAYLGFGHVWLQQKAARYPNTHA